MYNTRKYLELCTGYTLTLLKWLGISLIVGAIGGYTGSFFHLSIDYVTELREEKDFIIYFIPLGGLLIAAVYSIFKSKAPLDTNRPLRAAMGKDNVPLVMAPLIFIGTCITHLVGGSAGREGAALQLGGSVGYNVGKALRLKKSDMNIIVMAGMSAVFAALFGTPLTAAIFAIEVCMVGMLHYSAFLPSVAAACTAAFISNRVGLSPVHFELAPLSDVSILNIIRTVILAIGCAMVAMLFCYCIHKSEKLFKKYLPSIYLRALAGGVILLGLTLAVGVRDYNGAGMDIVARALGGNARPEAFMLKIIFTAVTIAAGFKGGEIVPTFFIGSTFGCAFASLIGLDPSFGAATGFVATFCSVVNCPIASIVLSFEVFGGDNILLFALACAISYMMSGYCSLYSSQGIYFSKLGDEPNIKNGQDNKIIKINSKHKEKV